MAAKKALGTLQRDVQVHQPVCDRRPRREDKGGIGAGPEFERLTLDYEVRHHPSPILDDSNWLIISPGMVNDRLKTRCLPKCSMGEWEGTSCATCNHRVFRYYRRTLSRPSSARWRNRFARGRVDSSSWPAPSPFI